MLASKLAFFCTPTVHARCRQHLAVVHTHRRFLTADRRASHSQATTSAGQYSSDLGSYPSGKDKSPLHTTAATQQASAATATGGRLILLDAFALLYRAHFGLKDVRLATSTGEDTSILFAFLRSLLGLLELEPPPTHFAVVFDAAGKTFRHEMYPGYKGQRPRTPEAITEAVKQLRDLIRVMGIPEIIVPGIEADDVIGTVASRALKEGLQVAIASPDKDFFQLLQPRLQLLRPPKKDYQGPLLGGMVPYNSQAFQEEWDLQPSQWVDVLALSGDSADNIPGVKGVGIKTAPTLVRAHGDIEGVLAAAPAEKKKGLREKLTNPEAANAARLSKKLVTIHTDIVLPPVRFPMNHLALQSPTDLTRAAVKAAFASLEFAQHERRLEAIWDNMARSQAELSGGAGAQGWHSAIKPASEFVTG
ncbi:hypothetical protein ABBQ32_013081 [Trebouxia sp. C0010 RCD-2024]